MKYQFISALQQGIAAQTSETAGSRRSLSVDLSVEANKDIVSLAPAGKRLTIFGPGDVLGINPAAIIRTEPASNVGDFEPNYFPFVEFGEADFLWRYSLGPVVDKEEGKENEKGVIPWLTLLVLESPQTRKHDDETGEFAYYPPSTEELPASIRIRQGASLPDLSGAWRYAHVQIAKFTGERTEENLLPEDPAQSLCRLFCPRRLKGSTKYTAFIVPTYQAGRLRGVGADTGLDTAKLSWEEGEEVEGGKLTAVNDLQMPYYHQWEFHTSVRGDFESLVRQLEPRTLSNLGTFPVDVSHPAKGLDACPKGEKPDPEAGEKVKGLIKMEGALQAIDTEYSEWGADHSPPYQDDDPNKKFRASLEEHITAETKEPTIGPPLYGAWHHDGIFSNDKGWWRELNLDPRHRYVAGLGDQVIKEHQEAFMAEAWRQLGEIKEANRQVSLARYGSQISRSVFNRIEKMTYAQQLQTVSPIAHQVKATNEQGLEVGLDTLVTNSTLPNGALAANFRKVLRTRGKLGKKLKGQQPIAALNNMSTDLVAKKLPVTDQLLATFGETTSAGDHRSQSSSSTSLSSIRPFRERLKGDDVRLPLQQWNAIEQGIVIQQPVPEHQIRRHRNRNLQGQISGLKDPRSWRGYKVRVRDRRNRARINRRGEFRMKLPNGKHTLYISEVNIEFDVNISKGITILLNLELGRSGAITGQIMGTDQRHKTSGKVTVKGTTTTASIGENGAYKLSLPEGDHQLLVQSGGDTHEFTVHAQAGEALLFDVELDQNIKLEATALNLAEAFDPQQLEPAKTIGAVLAERFGLALEAALQPLVYEPKFPYPMADFLTEDQLLPGLDRVPRNTVALLETNNRFLEAFMVGLNHAFAGEALWREYPIPLSTTVFQHFWDKEEIEKEGGPDIRPIKEEWKATDGLGNNAIDKGEDSENQLVLLLRSDLFRKYPDMSVYLVKADNPEKAMDVFSSPAETLNPIFQGELPPDIAYWGFPRTEEQVRGHNYYLIFEETSLSLRLGLDETDDDRDGFSSFSDFNMDHPGDYLPKPPDKDSWKELSAAALTVQSFIQKPVRLAIALDKLLPLPSSEE